MTRQLDRRASGFGRRDVLRAGLGVAAAGVVGFPFISQGRAASPVAGKTVGFSQSYATDEWLKAQRNDVLFNCERYGLKTVVTDAKEKPAQEIRNLEDLAVRGVDLVIMITYYAEAIGPGVKALNDKGIPIVVMSSSLKGDVDWACHLAVDTLGTSRSAGQYYVDQLGGKGKVVQIEGKPGSMVNQARGKGWREVMDKNPGIEIVAHGVANYHRGEALKMMEDFLQAHKHIDAVYAHNDNMAKGALQAIKEAGRDKEMWVTGYDGLEAETLEMIYNGDLRATWLYPTFGAEAVEVAVRVLQGQKVPKEIEFPSGIIDKNNIADYYDPKTRQRKPAPVRLDLLGL